MADEIIVELDAERTERLGTQHEGAPITQTYYFIARCGNLEWGCAIPALLARSYRLASGDERKAAELMAREMAEREFANVQHANLVREMAKPENRLAYLELHIAKVLRDVGAQTVDELAAAAGVSRGDVARSLDVLRAYGYVREYRILDAPSQWALLSDPT